MAAADGRDVVMYHSIFPTADIHCFEPIPESFAKLNDNVKRPDCGFANNVAVSDAIGLIYTEINFLDHFEGGVRFAYLMTFLCDWGFRLHYIYGLTHNQRGELAWGDAIFLRC